MKIRVILISVIAVAAAATIAVVFMLRNSGAIDELTATDLDKLGPADRIELMERAFASGAFPAEDEAAFVAWAWETDPVITKSLIRDNANTISNLPAFISEAALILVKQRKIETGLEVLKEGQNLFPNNPDILGITGVVAFLGGNPVEARKFLEESESWRQDRPIVNYYLGGILVDSLVMADRARGKNLLIKVIQEGDEELAELSSLILLTQPEVPLIEDDVELLMSKLDELNVFREDNSNLSVDALRVIINRLVPYRPKEALELADLLMQYPGASLPDRLGLIQLAQDQGQIEIAGDQLDAVDTAAGNIPEGSPTALRLERLRALQLLAEESFIEGEDAFQMLVESQPDEPSLRNAFQTAFQYELPIETQKSLLAAFLSLPVENVENSLSVLSRLVNIDPLNEGKWIGYAGTELLHRRPIIVSQWLMAVDSTELAVETLAAKTEPLTGDESIALVESYLYLEQPDQAEPVLKAVIGEIDPTIYDYLHCRILVQQDKDREAFEVWKMAQQKALGGGKFTLLKNLGFLALELDQEINALQSLYTAFSSGIPFTPEQAIQLLGLTLQFGSLRQSIEISGHLAEKYPDNPTYINNLAYFNFLAEDNVEKSIDQMRDLIEEYTDINEYRLTLALGLVKAGRTNEASRIVQSTNIDWTTAKTRSQLIYAVVLAASNQRVVAEGLLRNLNLEELIPEEQALIEAF